MFGEVETYSGFLTVNGSSHLYLLLQLAEEAPARAPLVVWLNGGPGWPSLYGAFKVRGAGGGQRHWWRDEEGGGDVSPLHSTKKQCNAPGWHI